MEAYRAKASPRTLVLDLRPRSVAGSMATGLGLLLMAAACWAWLHGSSADVVHEVGPKTDLLGAEESCSPATPFERHEVGPLTLSRLYSAWTDGGHANVTWGRSWEPPALFLLALLALLGPRLAGEGASLVLDEREQRLSILRWRLGKRGRLDRPLRDLREAVLVDAGKNSSAQLVFANDERIGIAAPVADANAQARLVAAINDFVGARR